MKTILATYPGFQALPKGIKQLLVASESFFFQDAMSLSAATVADDLINGREWCPSNPLLTDGYGLYEAVGP